MLHRHTLTKHNGKWIIINPTGPYNLQNKSVCSSTAGFDIFCIHQTSENVSYGPLVNSLVCLDGFNAGCVPFRCTVNVDSVDRRILTAKLSITETESKRYNLPNIQSIQIEVLSTIDAEEFQKLSTTSAVFEALYPFRIEKPQCVLEIKDYSNHALCTGESRKMRTINKKDGFYTKPDLDPKYQMMIQRPNQVWDITRNEWIIVPKPHPRNRAWSWNEETLSWVCQKIEETGELMPLDRKGRTNCWSPESVATE